VLTLVTRNNESHRAYRSRSDNPLQGTTLGGRTDDPRANGIRTAAACHPAGGAAWQCQPGLPGGRDLAGPVLSVAPAVGALRAGRRASAPAPGPRRPTGAAGAGDRTPTAERGGERGDVGRRPDRSVSATHRWQLRVAPSTVQRALRRAGLATRRQRLLVLEQRAAQTAGLLTTRTRRALWQAQHGQPRHVAAREPGELVCLDTFYIGQLKGVGKVWPMTACDAACSWGGLAVARPHGRGRRSLPAPGPAPHLSPGGLAPAPGAHRWRPRVQGGVR
jgi:hypothetical protein